MHFCQAITVAAISCIVEAKFLLPAWAKNESCRLKALVSPGVATPLHVC